MIAARRGRVVAALGGIVVALGVRAAGAQVVPTRPRPVTQADSGARKAAADSTLRAQQLIVWAPMDSTAFALMKRPGYTSVRYQSATLDFNAKSRVITLVGDTAGRAGVERQPTTLVADTIAYNDLTDSVRARGDTIRLRDQAKNEDMVALGRTDYDLRNREGTMSDVATTQRSGELWHITAHRGAFASDSSDKGANSLYGQSGTITSCQDSVPHYHFSAGELKQITGNVMVARNVVMHIEGVPVLWIPFIFQDSRSGRRSGILTPRFGITELVRNSPYYRRTVENVGYYFTISDYTDASVSMDWRSSARATDADPGWTRWNGELRYRWLNRFISGRVAASFHTLSSGTSNTSISWQHNQDFSKSEHLTASLNFVTSTVVQRQTTINPIASVGTIGSQLNYQRAMGPLQLSIGGSRRQYPGRPQVDQEFPTLSLTSKPISAGEWLTWTPGLTFSSSQSQHIDAQADFTQRLTVRSDGTLDSVKIDRSRHASTMSLSTPFKIFDFQIQAAVRASDNSEDYPQYRLVIDPVDTSRKSNRVFDRTYLSSVDFDLSMALPNLFQGTWNLVPSVTMSNVGPGAYWVRSERTGRNWVSQSKRLSYGLGVSPTFFALIPGIGPMLRLRHSVTTSFSYSYSPAATLNPQYLAALGQTAPDFNGALAQNRVTLGINQVFEAKFRSKPDSAHPPDPTQPDQGTKVKLLSLAISPLTYDFEKARKSKSGGFATDAIDFSVRSDLLPGFDFGANYSLFQGSVLSDSARLSPYLTSIRASFSLGATNPVVRFFGKLFGSPEPPPPAKDSTIRSNRSDVINQSAQNAVGGSQPLRGAPIDIPQNKGFDANLSFALSQQRPPVGGNVVQYDPTLQCAPYKDANPIQYDICVRNALAAPPATITGGQTTAGGTFFRVPPQSNINSRIGFSLTPKWSGSWSTNYDFQRGEFGLQAVTLSREMHDWRAVFGFTQAPNGNFAFTFFVALKAEPDIKFNYDRSSYGTQTGTIR